MLFNVSFTALLWVLLVFKSHVDAAVLKRDVFDPPITYPAAGTVWQVGEIHNVTWNTAILPANFTGKGMIVLGFLNDTANDGNEHLDLANPLATGFPLSFGSVNITVPSVPAKDSYILILFGDSGNASPQFTISNLTIGMSPSPTPSSLPPSSPTSAPPSSINRGSGSTAQASSLNSPSFTLISASNPPLTGSSPAPSSVPAEITSIALSASLSKSPTSSSSGSPSTPISGSQNGIAEKDNAARANSINPKGFPGPTLCSHVILNIEEKKKGIPHERPNDSDCDREIVTTGSVLCKYSSKSLTMGRSAKTHKRVQKKALSQSQTISASQIAVKQSQVTMPNIAQVKRKNKLKAKVQAQSNDGKEKILGDIDYVTLMLGGRRKAKEEANKMTVDPS